MTVSAAVVGVSQPCLFAALDDAPMTPTRYAFWLLASGGTLLDGFSVVVLGIALPLLKLDFAISPVLVGLIGSALVLGAVLGAGGAALQQIHLAGSPCLSRIWASSWPGRYFPL